MNQFVTGQRSLSNFFQSVIFASPTTAAVMHEDVLCVALNAMSPPASPSWERGKECAESLRTKALELPEIQRRVLDNALSDLGYKG